MMILFYLIFLLFEKHALDSLLYVLTPPIILLGIDVLFSSYVFSLDFIMDSIIFYVIPIIGLIVIL